MPEQEVLERAREREGKSAFDDKKFNKIMPRGDKSSYSGKQKRQAGHIEESYESRGISPGEAKRRAWATVNKNTGGGHRKNK